jgi:GH18 family chitinase
MYKLLLSLLLVLIGCSKNDTFPEKEEIIITDNELEYTIKKGERIILSPNVSGYTGTVEYMWEYKEERIGNQAVLKLSSEIMDRGENTIKMTVITENNKTSVEYSINVLNADKYKKIGYWGIFSNNIVLPTDAQLEKLTHLICSFLVVSEDGSLSNQYFDNVLTKIIEKAHHKGVYVLIAIGGGANEKFGKCISKEQSLNSLTANILQYTNLYNIDGVDIDFEVWTGGNSSADVPKQKGLLSLLRDLKQKLPEGQILAMPVMTTEWSNYNYTTEMFQYLDWV